MWQIGSQRGHLCGWLSGRRMRRWLIAVVLACASAMVLHSHVYTDFERMRFRVVTSAHEESAGMVVVALPDLDSLAGQAAAVVVRLANSAGAPRVVQIAAGREVLGKVAVPSGREVRIDLSVPDGAVLADASHVELTAEADGWALTYLEVANIRGFSTGLFEYVITPATPTPNHLGAIASVPAFGLLLTLYGVCWRRIAHRQGRAAHTAAAALVVSLLAAVLAVPFVSDSRVHLAAHTLLVCLAVLYYPALAVLARETLRAFGRVVASAPQATGTPVNRVVMRVVPLLTAARDSLMRAARWLWQARIPVAYAAAIVLFVTSVTNRYDPDTGLTSLIRFGDRFEHRVLPSVRAVPRHVYEDSPGYDGQFYAQLAVDPLLLDPATHDALDVPAYRARRILFSWTAYLAGLGRPDRIVHAYAIQYVVLWLLLAWVLCHWFPPTSVRNLAMWFACLFSEGLILSVLSSVPDGPSMLLLLAGAAAMERGRTNLAAAVVGFACLAKSTNVLWLAMVVSPDEVRHCDWRGLLLRGVLLAAPGVVWIMYLLLGSDELGEVTDLVGDGNFGVPFVGYATKWATTLVALRDVGWDSPVRFSLLALIGLTTQSIVLLAVRDWRNPWWRAGLGSIVLMAFLGPAVWEGHPAAFTRVLLPMAFAFNAILPRTAWFWPLFVLGNLSVLHSLDALRVPF